MACLSHRCLFETSITQDEKSSIIETISPSTKNPLPPVHKFFNISSKRLHSVTLKVLKLAENLSYIVCMILNL